MLTLIPEMARMFLFFYIVLKNIVKKERKKIYSYTAMFAKQNQGCRQAGWQIVCRVAENQELNIIQIFVLIKQYDIKSNLWGGTICGYLAEAETETDTALHNFLNVDTSLFLSLE